jgi:hypothetical protein
VRQRAAAHSISWTEAAVDALQLHELQKDASPIMRFNKLGIIDDGRGQPQLPALA